MFVVGISGEWDEPYAAVDPSQQLRVENWSHDSAAVLLKDGEIVAAIEEERLSRVKHTGHRALNAIRFCCDHAGVPITEIDLIAYASDEQMYDMVIAHQTSMHPEITKCFLRARSYMKASLSEELQMEVDESRIRFVDHHLCHAVSTFALSGYDQSLVVTLDGEGNGTAGSVYVGRGTELQRIRRFVRDNSLGSFYVQVTRLLGFRPRDEFKVMGLAPYGNPARHRHIFEELVTLEPEGRYRVQNAKLPMLLRLCDPRRARDPILENHKDIAASLQETIERASLHLLRHFRAVTGLRRMCMAGGVAQNCTMTGVVERSGIFDDIFICPASHDAGGAIGAAISAYWNEPGSAAKQSRKGFPSVYLGTDIDSRHLESMLAAWGKLIRYEKRAAVADTAADRLADGAVIGWVQGRSEFGPRALGNRSILADPRPASNRRRINAMIKKREGFRPFAPSVPLELSHVYFDVPAGREYPYMGIVVHVREEYRSLLGAITHVDGSARLQTVTCSGNEGFWRLLNAFGARTGVPILLNTSFNNNVEPIVDSVDDSIACFLTTSLDYLVVGDYMITRAAPLTEGLLDMRVELAPQLQLREVKQYDGRSKRFITQHVLTNDHSDKFYVRTYERVSERMYGVLRRADDLTLVRHLIDDEPAQSTELLLGELVDLWSNRLIRVRPKLYADEIRAGFRQLRT